MSNVVQASAFNPFTQTFTLLKADGVTPFEVDIPTLDAFILESIEVSINYASQIGASIVMLVVVLLVTRDSKRRSSLFAINIISLLLSIIRSILQTLYFTSAFSEVYAFLSRDFSAVPRSDYATSIAQIVLTLLLLCTVELSLVIQTRFVCITLRERHRMALVALSIIITLLAVGFRFADMVQNARAIIALETTDSIMWIASAALIMETISIWYFSLVFVGKLAITLYQRRKLGLRQWGPMQVICIMGGCTMIIPSVFAISEYFPNNTFPEAGSLALTLVAIFLPLSSIWAAAAIDGASPISRSESAKHLGGSHYSDAYTIRSGSTFDRKASLGPLSESTVRITVEHVPVDFTSVMTKGNMIGDSKGDFQRAGVRIDKSFSVTRD